MLKTATEDAIKNGKEISEKVLNEIVQAANDAADETTKFVQDKTNDALNEANEASKKLAASLEKGVALVKDQVAEKVKQIQDDVIDGAQKAVTAATKAIEDAPKKLEEVGKDLVLAAKETGEKAKEDLEKAAELVGKVVVGAKLAGKLAVGVTKLALMPLKNLGEAATEAANKVAGNAVGAAGALAEAAANAGKEAAETLGENVNNAAGAFDAIKDQVGDAVEDAKQMAEGAVKAVDEAKNKLGNDAKKAFEKTKQAADDSVRKFKEVAGVVVVPKAFQLADFVKNSKVGNFAGELDQFTKQLVEDAKKNGLDGLDFDGAIAASLKGMEKLEQQAAKTKELMDSALEAGLKEAEKVANAALDHADRAMNAAAEEHQKVMDAASELATAMAGGAKKIGAVAGKVIGEVAGNAADEFGDAKNKLNKGFEVVSTAADKISKQVADAAGGATKATLELADKVVGGVIGGAQEIGGKAMATPAGQLAARVNSFLGETGNAVAGAGEQAISDARKISATLAKQSVGIAEKFGTDANSAVALALGNLKKDIAIVGLETSIRAIVGTIAQKAQILADEVSSQQALAAKAVNGAVENAINDAVTVGNALLNKASSVAQDIAKQDIATGKIMKAVIGVFDSAVDNVKNLVANVANTLKKPESTTPTTTTTTTKPSTQDTTEPDTTPSDKTTKPDPDCDDDKTKLKDALANIGNDSSIATNDAACAKQEEAARAEFADAEQRAKGLIDAATKKSVAAHTARMAKLDAAFKGAVDAAKLARAAVDKAAEVAGAAAEESKSKFNAEDGLRVGVVAEVSTLRTAANLALNATREADAATLRDAMDDAAALHKSTIEVAGVGRNRSLTMCAKYFTERLQKSNQAAEKIDQLASLAAKLRECHTNSTGTSLLEIGNGARLRRTTSRAAMRECQEIGARMMRFRSMNRDLVGSGTSEIGLVDGIVGKIDSLNGALDQTRKDAGVAKGRCDGAAAFAFDGERKMANNASDSAIETAQQESQATLLNATTKHTAAMQILEAKDSASRAPWEAAKATYTAAQSALKGKKAAAVLAQQEYIDVTKTATEKKDAETKESHETKARVQKSAKTSADVIAAAAKATLANELQVAKQACASMKVALNNEKMLVGQVRDALN